MSTGTPTKRTPPPRVPERARKQSRSQAEDHASTRKSDDKDTKAGRKLDFEPSALYELIEYSREGEVEIDPDQYAVYEFILRTCDIPRDFEANHKYGPKSGITYEQRLINAFCFGMFPIPPKAETLRPKLKRFVTNRRWHDASELVAAN